MDYFQIGRMYYFSTSEIEGTLEELRDKVDKWITKYGKNAEIGIWASSSGIDIFIEDAKHE